MAEGITTLAAAHNRIVERLEALERFVKDDKEQRRAHFDQHNRLEERQKSLEESVSLLDKVAARKASVEEALVAQFRDLRKAEARIDALEARLASKPDDFGGVTSTGAPRRGQAEPAWWVIAKEGRPDLVFSPHNGFILWTRQYEYTWALQSEALKVCEMLFGDDDSVSVMPARYA